VWPFRLPQSEADADELLPIFAAICFCVPPLPGSARWPLAKVYHEKGTGTRESRDFASFCVDFALKSEMRMVIIRIKNKRFDAFLDEKGER
jgi:hypothetical protein